MPGPDWIEVTLTRFVPAKDGDVEVAHLLGIRRDGLMVVLPVVVPGGERTIGNVAKEIERAKAELLTFTHCACTIYQRCGAHQGFTGIAASEDEVDA